MILANGKLYDSAEQNLILDNIEDEINRTRAEKTLTPDIVINALCLLADKAKNGAYDDVIASLGVPNADEYLKTALNMLSREQLNFKLRCELGANLPGSSTQMPSLNGKRITNRVLPLGTLFHIAAGNVDGLPAYSVAEGLLCGNVNILKLPMADNNLSIKLLSELISIDPRIAPFVYVFDTPSEDVEAMRKMANICDGIVLWGGEAAERAVRRMAPTGVKLIEWGHKLSFAYISNFRSCESELPALAKHIIQTKQLLCSSCQNILIDTDSIEEIEEFCTTFFPYLQAAASRQSSPISIGDRAEKSLFRYTKKLEMMIGAEEKPERFSGDDCVISVSTNKEPELSPMFGHVIVKMVPRNELLSVLRKTKGVLQTAGLICPASERKALTDLLFRSGVTKITRSGTMSDAFIGESHDGEFPLRRYIRIASEEE